MFQVRKFLFKQLRYDLFCIREFIIFYSLRQFLCEKVVFGEFLFSLQLCLINVINWVVVISQNISFFWLYFMNLLFFFGGMVVLLNICIDVRTGVVFLNFLVIFLICILIQFFKRFFRYLMFWFAILILVLVKVFFLVKLFCSFFIGDLFLINVRSLFL